MLALLNVFHSKMKDNKENYIGIIIMDSHLPKLIESSTIGSYLHLQMIDSNGDHCLV